ncbi:UNVERIFIED_CONTAM: hypothetical protein GTU68_006184 [Idotea baltica]|nr:hypothetical protein [Idotea baltica]
MANSPPPKKERSQKWLRKTAVHKARRYDCAKLSIRGVEDAIYCADKKQQRLQLLKVAEPALMRAVPRGGSTRTQQAVRFHA